MMSDHLTRREFLKVAGMGAGATAVLTGCGPTSRYVTRQPYAEMPEYTSTGKSTYFATTCGECSAACGLIVRTMEGRAHKVDGNPDQPISLSGTCSRGQATLQGLYNPDRIQEPGKQEGRGSGTFNTIDWDAAIGIVKEALGNPPDQIAFLMGLFPDHLHDLVQLISKGLGQMNLLRYGTLGEFEARVSLMQAAEKLFGTHGIPHFDIEHAEMLVSFGANFVETWLSPVHYAYGYGMMRQGQVGQRGYLVQFEPRMSQTAANADEWYPITPGSEALLAQGLGQLVAEIKMGSAPPALAGVNISEVAKQTGVEENDLRRLASLFAASPRPLALAGSIPLGTTTGLAAAEAILALNILADNISKDGGVFFLPDSPLYPDLPYGPSSIAEVSALIERMNQGQIKVLFVHGVNPVYDLPKAYGFTEALQKVPRVISFASFPDETSLQADYVLPDSTPLESWGYQKVFSAGNRTTIGGLQPVVVPLYNTRPTADVLLAATQAVGGNLAAAVPYSDEVEFLQASVAQLMNQGGFYTAPTPEAFWALWQQHGGWWKAQPERASTQATSTFDQPASPGNAQFTGDMAEYPLYLLPFPSPNLGDGSAANRPTLQETPDPMTTAMWNTWVEINPDTASKLGIANNDVVMISSPAGQVEAIVYTFPGIHPDVIAIPLGQGHTAFGRFAKGRGSNPQDLLAKAQNEAGNLAFLGTRVKITPTGKRFSLALYENREGVSEMQKGVQGE